MDELEKGATLMAAIALAALTGFGVHLWDGRALAKEQAQRLSEEKVAAQAALVADQHNRALEAQMQQGVNDGQKRYEGAVATANAAAKSAAAELDRLRKQLASAGDSGTAQAPGGGRTPDAGADGAAVLRFVVGDCAARYARVAGEADALGAQVVGLQDYIRALSPSTGGPATKSAVLESAADL